METEHRPLIRWQFPEWEERVEYWEVHDLDLAAAEVGLAELRARVEKLVERLGSERPRPPFGHT